MSFEMIISMVAAFVLGFLINGLVHLRRKDDGIMAIYELDDDYIITAELRESPMTKKSGDYIRLMIDRRPLPEEARTIAKDYNGQQRSFNERRQ